MIKGFKETRIIKTSAELGSVWELFQSTSQTTERQSAKAHTPLQISDIQKKKVFLLP